MKSRIKVFCFTVTLICVLCLGGVGVLGEELICPLLTGGHVGDVYCKPAVYQLNSTDLPVGWCGQAPVYSGNAFGILLVNSMYSFNGCFPTATYVTRIEILNQSNSLSNMQLTVKWINQSGQSGTSQTYTIPIGGTVNIPINSKMTSFAFYTSITPFQNTYYGYKIFGTPNSIAWTDITGSDIASKLSGQTIAANITGNASTAANATYATSAGNADTVDSSHSSAFATVSHSHTLASLSEKNFSSLTGKPTTLGGYGITDATSSVHNHTLASLSEKSYNSLTNKPTASGQVFNVVKDKFFKVNVVGSYTNPTGLTAIPALSGDATEITGTLNSLGIQKINCSSGNSIYFNVIDIPSFGETATVTFS